MPIAAAIDRGLGQIGAVSTAWSSAVGSIHREREARLARIMPAATHDWLAPATLVIEAIVEDLDIKASLLGRWKLFVDTDAIVATNTSSLSVTALAARLRRPERVVGMHFFNPAPQLPLVEVVSGHRTIAESAGHRLRPPGVGARSPVHCRSTPGFIVNRVARPFYGEALRLLREGVATRPRIDAVLCEAGGFRWARSSSWT